MEWYRCFLLLTLLSWTVFLQAHAYLHQSIVTSTEAGWTEASHECDLATPPIHFSRKYNTVNVRGIPEIAIWNTVWVGYVMEWAAFEYVGCANKADIFRNFLPTFLDVKDDPGQCYSACGYSEYFGLLFHECYCLTKEMVSTVKNKRQFCNQCMNGLPAPQAPQGPACGTYRNTSNIALYRVNKEVDVNDIPVYESPSNRYQVCLGYMPANDSYMWAKCDVRMRIMCKYEDGKVRPRAGLTPWIGSVIRCHKNRSDPVTFTDARFVQKYSKDSWMWTGVVRGQVIYRYTDHVHPIRYDRTWFGYVTKYALDGFVLEFTPTHLEKRAVCTSALVTPTKTTTESGISAGVTGKTYGKPFATLETPAIRENGSKSQTESSVPIYVLILVVVVFTLIIAGLIALMLWKNQKQKKKNVGNQKVASKVAFSNINVDNAEYAEADDALHITAQTANPSQHFVTNDYYVEPVSTQITNNFHNYDTPPSNQHTTSHHYDKPKEGQMTGAYESLGHRNVYTYDTVSS